MSRWRILALVLGFPLLLLALAVAQPGPSRDLLADLTAPYRYNLVQWEFHHLVNKWLYLAGGLFRDHQMTRQEEDNLLAYYFALVEEINGLSRQVGEAGADAPDAASLRQQLIAKQAERQELENAVEAVIEGRVSAVLEDQGLKRHLPIFTGVRFLFPPVDFEFDGPPRALVISPRQRIELQRVFLLRNDIDIMDMLRLEERSEAAGVSALVVTTGGVATYPSVVPESSSYDSVLETVAHEWVHQYLFFSPLGRRYFRNEELRTLNETVANIAGREIARLVRQRFGGLGEEAKGATSRASNGVDFNREMRALRRRVDELLAQGRVEEAERLMEEKRRYLAENGFYIRKINQAYFAWYGLYADTPASSSPLGPKLEELWRRSPSVGDFLRRVAAVTSAAELDRLLSQVPTPTPP